MAEVRANTFGNRAIIRVTELPYATAQDVLRSPLVPQVVQRIQDDLVL